MYKYGKKPRFLSVSEGGSGTVQGAEREKSYRIAVCSMAMALAALVLVLGHHLTFGEFFWYYVASLVMDMPERTSDKVLCYLGTSFLAAVLCGFHFIYLASFCLLMGPYVLAKAAVRGRPAAVQYTAVTAVCFVGLLCVCWWTPMFFVQISTLQMPAAKLIAAGVIAGASLLMEPLYGRLFRFGKQILLKVWFRLT